MRLLRRLHLCPGLHAAAKYKHEKSQKSQGRQFFMFTCDFSQFTVLVGALSTPLLQIFTDSTNFPIFCISYNIRNFRKNCSSCRGPLNSFFYKFSLHDSTIFHFFANFTIFAIFAKLAVLVGALSTSSSTGFHSLNEFSNFSQILQFSQLRANLDI